MGDVARRVEGGLRAALTDDERTVVETLTQRQTLPTSPVRELWLLLGRRSGKSIIAALIAVWATCCRSYALAPGEVGVFMVIAADRKQARVIKRYICGLLRAHPSLEALIDHETADAIWLTNGLCIEIHTCSASASLRGYTCHRRRGRRGRLLGRRGLREPGPRSAGGPARGDGLGPRRDARRADLVYARRGEVWRMFRSTLATTSSATCWW